MWYQFVEHLVGEDCKRTDSVNHDRDSWKTQNLLCDKKGLARKYVLSYPRMFCKEIEDQYSNCRSLIGFVMTQNFGFWLRDSCFYHQRHFSFELIPLVLSFFFFAI